jgi:hypothetical protein
MACVSGACTGTCAPGATMCVSESDFETCGTNGQWGAQQLCPNEACVNNGCTGVCSPGAFQCVGSQPQQCQSDGTWGDSGPACTGGCTSGCGGIEGGPPPLDGGGSCGGSTCASNAGCCTTAPYCPNNGSGTGNCTTLMCQGVGGTCATTTNCCAPYSCSNGVEFGGFGPDGGIQTMGMCQ